MWHVNIANSIRTYSENINYEILQLKLSLYNQKIGNFHVDFCYYTTALTATKKNGLFGWKATFWTSPFAFVNGH